MSKVHDIGVGSVSENQSFRSRLSKHSSNRYEQSSINSEENQFLKAYAGASNYHTLDPPKGSPSLSGSPKKKTIIEQLTEKNDMLKKEVDRVEEILNGAEQRKGRFKRLPEIASNVLKKQLQNAYKQIKFYEIQVSQRQKLFEHEGTYVDMIRKSERTLIERQDLVKKLQAEISELKKQSNEFVKLLQDGHISKQYALRSSKLHKEIKYYQTMLEEQAQLEKSQANNTEQQKDLIIKMEEELLNGGFSKAELHGIRRKYETDRNTNTAVTQREAPAEDRSKKAFEELKSQMNLFKKMQKDYAKKIEELQKQHSQANGKGSTAKERLLQAEQQLQNLQNQFIEMKKSIDPNKLRPAFKQAMLNESSLTQFGNGQGNPMEHRFQAVEAGKLQKKGQSFNDRLIIGKKSAKIVELTLFENRTQFLGIQATYLMGEIEKKGGQNVLRRQKERFLKDKTIKLDPGDYFKTFECSINKEDVIVGLLAVSAQGKLHKAGLLEGFKKELQMTGKEYPCCLFGCYTERGFEMLGSQKVQAA